MLEKIFNFLLVAFVDGIIAVLLTMLFCVIFEFIFLSAGVDKVVGVDFISRIVFVFIFVSLMLEDFNLPSIKEFLKRWHKNFF